MKYIIIISVFCISIVLGFFLIPRGDISIQIPTIANTFVDGFGFSLNVQEQNKSAWVSMSGAIVAGSGIQNSQDIVSYDAIDRDIQLVDIFDDGYVTTGTIRRFFANTGVYGSIDSFSLTGAKVFNQLVTIDAIIKNILGTWFFIPQDTDLGFISFDISSLIGFVDTINTEIGYINDHIGSGYNTQSPLIEFVQRIFDYEGQNTIYTLTGSHIVGDIIFTSLYNILSWEGVYLFDTYICNGSMQGKIFFIDCLHKEAEEQITMRINIQDNTVIISYYYPSFGTIHVDLSIDNSHKNRISIQGVAVLDTGSEILIGGKTQRKINLILDTNKPDMRLFDIQEVRNIFDLLQ